jgi:hypothetical protein
MPCRYLYVMGKRLIISESEKNDIRKMYGLIKEQAETPTCNDNGCSGKYVGPEFKDDKDVAHQYSNVITKAVATKLKELYTKGKFVKVNFDGIKLSTKGMGSGNVEYEVEIPFTSVQNKCEARTGFGHVGGWGHEGAGVSKRKSEIYNDVKTDPTTKKPIFDQKGNQIRTNPVVGTIQDMEESKRTSTPEGLVEYWIQWKHSDYQSDCGKSNNQQNTTQQITPSKKTNIQDNTAEYDEFAKRIKTETENVSINLDSIDFEITDRTFTFSPGNQKIKKIILVIGREAEGLNMNQNFEQKITNIRNKNPEYTFTPRNVPGTCPNCLIMKGKPTPIKYQLFIMEEKTGEVE